MTAIKSWRVRRFCFPRDRAIGDWAVSADMNNVAALELEDQSGEIGIGFFDSLFAPLPARGWLTDYIDRMVWPLLAGSSPEGLLHRVSRERAGRRVAHPFGIGDAIDVALWDLASRRANQPLWRYLGGVQGSAPCYASGLCFNLSTRDLQQFYSEAHTAGHCAYKVKLGFAELGADLERLGLVRAVICPEALLMADANERWDVAETQRRIGAFSAAGYNLHWIEDPITRDDTAGLTRLRGSLGLTRVNSGEYLGADARVALLAAGAVDVIPVHDNISEGLRIGRAAAIHGVPVTVGNTLMNIGAHVAAALPDVDHVEDSRLNTTDLLVAPLPIVSGRFELPDTPGHGLAIDADRGSDFEDEG